jgi:trimeric autotransporter adhesin
LGDFFAGPNAGNLAMTGQYNTADGYNTLSVNTTGGYNLAAGAQALFNNLTGNFNTAVGDDAMKLNLIGGTDVAVGYQALEDATNLNYSTAVGYQALKNSVAIVNFDGEHYIYSPADYNTAIGYQTLLSNTGGSDNIAMGYKAGSAITGSDNIDIGNTGNSGDDNIIRIGTLQTATYLVGTVYANGFALTSDRNAKENFKPIDPRTVLAKVAALPVTEWNYKTEDKDSQHIGPMAQDFQAAFQLSADDKHISVVDEGGVALAAIQGLDQKVEEKDVRIQSQAAEIAELKARLDRLEQAISGN